MADDDRADNHHNETGSRGGVPAPAADPEAVLGSPGACAAHPVPTDVHDPNDGTDDDGAHDHDHDASAC
jgi:hypothetical protein